MRKLLSIGTKEFLSGISQSAHNPTALWHKATGVNPFIDPFPESANVGILQTSPSGTDITNAVVTDIPLAYQARVTAANTGTLYIWGSGGRLYSYDLSGDNNPALVKDTGQVGASGAFLYKTRGGTEYLYLVTSTQIFRYDFSTDPVVHWRNGGPGAGDSIDLQETTIHPSHNFLDQVFIGNKDRIAKIYDNSGTPTYQANALDFPSDYITTCLEDDGTYLIAGITKNQGDNLIFADTKVIFWDTNQSSWTREWSIPDTNIIAMQNVDGVIYAVCGRGLYAFTFSTPPVKIMTLGASTTPQYGYASAIGRFNNAVVWGGLNRVCGYGRFVPGMQNSYHEPFSVTATLTPTILIPDARIARFFVGGSAKLYRYSLTSGGVTSIQPESTFIKLEQESSIGRIDIRLATTLASGDSMTVSLQPDNDTVATSFGTASFANHGAVRRVVLYGKLTAEAFKLILNFTGGNIRILSIDIYGDDYEQ